MSFFAMALSSRSMNTEDTNYENNSLFEWLRKPTESDSHHFGLNYIGSSKTIQNTTNNGKKAIVKVESSNKNFFGYHFIGNATQPTNVLIQPVISIESRTFRSFGNNWTVYSN